MRPTEIESLTEFDQLVAHGTTSLTGFHLQSVDLTDRAEVLAGLDVSRAVFLGCRFAAGSEADVRARGGLVFPSVPDVPFDAYRGALYTPAELYAGLEKGYAATLDAAAYAWSRGPDTLDRSLAMALHDHAVDDAIDEAVEELPRDRLLVGVMGGHAVRRDTPAYLAAARLGASLGAHFTVLTGGGPGAMEAANLGAWLSAESDPVLIEAVDRLAAVPDFAPDVTAWARAAFDVLAGRPSGTASLGIPTWFYGHEPPNAFATAIAKYFRNALREDILLRLCRGGIVFLPGAAGTVQEIFQAACANYYSEPDLVVPMVFVGRDHWASRLPVWPLLEVLGNGRPFGSRLYLVDDPAEVLALLLEERGTGR